MTLWILAASCPISIVVAMAGVTVVGVMSSRSSSTAVTPANDSGRSGCFGAELNGAKRRDRGKRSQDASEHGGDAAQR